MPVPATKIVLNSTILQGGGYTLLPPNPQDLTATPLGLVGPAAIASMIDLNGDGLPT